MNAEELRRLRAEIAAIRPSRYGKISRSNILDLIDAAVARSNQLQVIERDRLARAIKSLAHGRCCWDPEQDADDILRVLRSDSTIGDPE